MPSFRQNILNVGINGNEVRGARWDELHALVKSQMLVQQARDDFLAHKLTVDEYLDLLDEHQINVDSYVKNVNQNLAVIGIKS